jgi:hypothetical protein
MPGRLTALAFLSVGCSAQAPSYTALDAARPHSDAFGSGSGSADGSSAQPDAAPAAPLTISGTVGFVASSAADVNAVITPYTANSGSAGSAVQENHDGTFKVTLDTMDGAFDGYLEVEVPNTNDGVTYVWPSAPLTTSLTGLNVTLPSTPAFLSGGLFQQCNGNTSTSFDTADGVVGIQVATLADGVYTGVFGVQIGLPTGAASVCYDKKYPAGDYGPDPTAIVTNDDGMAYLLNVPATDSLTLYASNGHGTIFKEPTIPVIAGAYTMAFIVEQ